MCIQIGQFKECIQKEGDVGLCFGAVDSGEVRVVDYVAEDDAAEGPVVG